MSVDYVGHEETNRKRFDGTAKEVFDLCSPYVESKGKAWIRYDESATVNKTKQQYSKSKQNLRKTQQNLPKPE